VNKPHQDSTPPELSRRSLLQSAAGAGLAVTAVTALGAAVGTGIGTSTGHVADATASSHVTAAGPLVVHVRDIKTGDIEVFSGTSQTRVRDRALAARIAQAIS
jgi:nitrous oxide reductase